MNKWLSFIEVTDPEKDYSIRLNRAVAWGELISWPKPRLLINCIAMTDLPLITAKWHVCQSDCHCRKPTLEKRNFSERISRVVSKWCGVRPENTSQSWDTGWRMWLLRKCSTITYILPNLITLYFVLKVAWLSSWSKSFDSMIKIL